MRDARVGDATICRLVGELEPFVRSRARIDDDGQELRYAENRDGQKSSRGLAVVNLIHIRAGLEAISRILIHLKYRVLELQDERTTGSYTRDCSRSDLKEIAAMLGDHASWSEDGFLDKKMAVCTRFGLSSGKFSDAVNKIRRSRELAALVGIETNLTYLSDDTAIYALEQWANANPERALEADGLGLDYFERDWDKVAEQHHIARTLDEAIIANLSDEELSDLEVLFYIGRGPEFGEHYEVMLARTVKKHRLAKSRWEGVHHIMSKASLLENVVKGSKIVGRPTLAAKLRVLRGAPRPR